MSIQAVNINGKRTILSRTSLSGGKANSRRHAAQEVVATGAKLVFASGGARTFLSSDALQAYVKRHTQLRLVPRFGAPS